MKIRILVLKYYIYIASSALVHFQVKKASKEPFKSKANVRKLNASKVGASS